MKDNLLIIRQDIKSYCKECFTQKSKRYCNYCKGETNTLWKAEFRDGIGVSNRGRNLFKSKERIKGKAKKEIEQYFGNKDQFVISEFEKNRVDGKPTEVIHRLFRTSRNGLVKVHEHKK